MQNQLRQYAQRDFCLECGTCCRFLDNTSEWFPNTAIKE